MSERGAAHVALRSGTASDHERLDGLFERFDLADPTSYRGFLTAHAKALPAVEHALDDAGFAALLPDWTERRRADALSADLAAVGAQVPAPLPFPVPESAAAQWGAAYVVEGSRLGGKLLSQRIGADLPRAYLGTPQSAGAWRRFLEALDAALQTPDDIAAATISARAVFALFEAAGRDRMESLDN